MRNLTTLWRTTSVLLGDYTITASAVDVEEDLVWVVSEGVRGEGHVMRTSKRGDEQEEEGGEEETEKEKRKNVELIVWKVQGDLIAKVVETTTTKDPEAPGGRHVVGLFILPSDDDERALLLLTRGGNIMHISVPPSSPPNSQLSTPLISSGSIDVIASISPSILTGTPSPDQTLLALLTPTTLILLSLPDLAPLVEQPLFSQIDPENVSVNAGWGSKKTQFHGKAGKEAALEGESSKKGTTSPDDDGAARVSWRGDGQYFAVSVLEAGEGREGSIGRRNIRVYTRTGTLWSIAEEVPGVEGPLAWRPSGGVMAGVQRFGHVPATKGGESSGESEATSGTTNGRGTANDESYVLASGRDGRHDVVFFERNGLRHGEFTLYEEGMFMSNLASVNSTRRTSLPPLQLRWGYRVRELLWNADSSVLAVWIERADVSERDGDGRAGRGKGDVVQLWTTGNWHWYLKLELSLEPDMTLSSLTNSGPSSTSATDVESSLQGERNKGEALTHVTWHPEDPGRMFLMGGAQITDVRLTRYTAVSPLGPPHDSGMVGVVDSNSLLLTPLRHSNIPPPMAAHTLHLGHGHVPVHLAFSGSPFVGNQNANNLNVDFDTADEKGSPRPPHPETLAILLPHNIVLVYLIPARLRRGEEPTLLWRGRIGSDVGAEAGAEKEEGRRDEKLDEGKQPEHRTDGRQIHIYTLSSTILITILCTHPQSHRDILHGITLTSAGEVKRRWTVDIEGGVNVGDVGRGMEVRGRIVGFVGENGGSGGKGEEEDGGEWAYQDSEGCIWLIGVPPRSENGRGVSLQPRAVVKFPVFCAQCTVVSRSMFVGLARGTLYVASPANNQGGAEVLAKACTSYAFAGSLLVWTQSAPGHEMVIRDVGALLEWDAEIRAEDENVQHEKNSNERKSSGEEHATRRIERGARIVTTVPGAVGVVLQMPRGNLETVYPRAMVLARVREEVGRGEYGPAFLTARKHRVDLETLVTADPARFARSTADVVKQLGEAQHLELLLAGLGRGTRPKEEIARLCDALREEMEARDVRRYLTAILTAHVVKTPPDYEGALALLLRLREDDPALVEDAVKYVIFLVDAERLFDTALGMYDFELVLLVAQHSQKDPREYLPFLRKLRSHQGPYQRFAIDNHLRRHSKALRNLHEAGVPYFDEARAYVVKHTLYYEALDLWRVGAERAVILEVYGDYLFERREFARAALAFVQATRMRKAMVAYEKALDWQALFDLAVREGLSDEELLATALRVADDLSTKRRHADAARVFLDYADDVDAAVGALVHGGEWAEARRITTLRQRADLVEAVIIPGALEARGSIADEIDEIGELRTKQVARLDELAAKKIEEPDAFYGVEDTNLANVDVMTDVSNPGTMYTRYTVAPSASSNRSKRTSRSKRKLGRKAGRKGTVEEEEYLLKSITKLVARFDAVLVEASSLLPQLLMLSEDLADEGLALQEEVGALESALGRDVSRVWDERSASPLQAQPQEPIPSDPAGESLAEKVPRPVISDVQWRIRWVGERKR